MQLVLTVIDPVGAAAPVDLEVTAPAGTPLGELRPALLAAVGRREGALCAHGTVLVGTHPVGRPPLVDGAVLTVDRPGHPELPGPPGLLELHVLAGPDSGAVHHLAPGEHGVGRAAEATVRLDDPAVSRLHAVLRVATGSAADAGPDGRCDPAATSGTTVHDLGSTNGTTVDGTPVDRAGRPLLPGQVLRVGDTRITLARAEVVVVSCRPDGAGHLAVNRPPRHLPVPAAVRVTAPVEPVPRERTRFPLLAMLLPLVAGVALVAVTRSPAYLVFVLLSPLMALGSFCADRVGGRRSARAQRSAYETEAARFAEVIDRAAGDERRARVRSHPGPAELLLTAAPRPRLWERRRTDPDALELRLGLGTVPATVEVRRSGGPGGAETVEHPDLRDTPVTVRLSDAGVLGLAGARDRVLPLARSLVAQLACWHSPRHLDLVVLVAEPSRDWEWTRWLPHRSGAGRPGVGLDDGQLRARIEELVALLDRRSAGSWPASDPAPPGATTVVVLDGAGVLRRQPEVARLLADGPASGLHFVCLEDQLVSLPVECRATVEVTGAVGTRLRVVAPDGTTYDDVVADGVSDRWAHRFARRLAPLCDATPDAEGSALPDGVRLLDLLPFDATDAAALETAWRVTPSRTRVALGVSADGEPFTIDLVADGPHALVAGTTGSGKSELLQTLVAGLAVANRPDELSFVLIDYKGGAAFKDCARLPHTVGTVTDLDAHLTERALRSLSAELRRRETLLRAAGCTDHDQYVAQAPGPPSAIPRLVLVVDEFAALADELPEFVGGLVGIAQRGRSLGVHLVLATQRPGGVVSADIRANTTLRIALRVTDPAESIDVVDVRDAADIDRTFPGRAVVRVAAGAAQLMQSARVGGHPESARPVTVRPLPWERVGDRPLRSSQAGPTGPTDLARIVDAARSAAGRLAAVPAASPWLPPLPTRVTVADLGSYPVAEGAVPFGLIDLPAEQSRAPLTFDLEGGDHLLVVGSARSGRSTVLRTLAATLAERHPPTGLHLFGLDGGGGALAVLTGLPHCGAVVGRDEPARGHRLLGRLAGELERRQRLLAAAGLGSHEEQRRSAPPADRLPWLVLLADGWEGLSAAFEPVDHGRPLDTLLRLVREGAGAGLRVVLTGDRGVLTGRVGSAFRDRLVLPLADPADYGLAGFSPRQVPDHLPAGRALVGPDAHEAQLAVLDIDTTGIGQVRAIEAVAAAARRRASTGPAPAGLPPIRVEPLPARLEVADIEADAKAASPGPGWALVGVGGDELRPTGVDLALDGPAFVVAGPAGSGRTTTLATMGRWLTGQGRRVVVLAHRRSPLRSLAGEAGVLAVLGPADVRGLEHQLVTHPDLVVLADDAETLQDTPVEGPLLRLLRADAEGGAALLLAGSSAELASSFRGLTVEARRGRTGLLLGFPRPLDGDLFGVPVPHGDAAPPGRGALLVRGLVTPVQVARTPL